MTVSLPPMPPYIARLPRDARGYPIPRFVDRLADRDGEPDFRFADGAFRVRAFKIPLCWVCGGRLGTHRVFPIGPMCVVNRTTLEPPCHRDCAEWSVKACPFLSRPRMRRNAKDVPEHAATPGRMIARNPGATCLYETRDYRALIVDNGWLIRLGPPDRIDWVAEGRPATRAEIEASIEGGYPLLMQEAAADGPEAIAELERLKTEAFALLPAA